MLVALIHQTIRYIFLSESGSQIIINVDAGCAPPALKYRAASPPDADSLDGGPRVGGYQEEWHPPYGRFLNETRHRFIAYRSKTLATLQDVVVADRSCFLVRLGDSQLLRGVIYAGAQTIDEENIALVRRHSDSPTRQAMAPCLIIVSMSRFTSSNGWSL